MKKILILTSIFIFSVVTGVFAQVQVPPTEITAEVLTGGGDNALVRVSYIFPDGYHQSFQKDFFSFSIESPAGATLGVLSYPAPADAGESFDFYGKTTLEAEITGYDGSEDLVIRARWQLCDEDGTCYFPASAAVTAEIIETGAPPRPAGRSENLLLILLMAFAGGLLLNVMPCVLPVLSIKALALVKQGGENRRQILGSSLLYTAGVIISLLALAVVVIVIKASGEQVGWGFQFQNRGFVIVLLTIIFVFALSLFDVFTISAPVMRTGAVASGKSGAGAHFFSGIIAVLLATPCTAPFLGTAAGFAFSQTPAVILSVFFMVGLGLASPFILIGAFPSAVKKLPKPGAWMNTFREVMGFLLLGTSVWLIDVLIHQSSQGFLTRLLIYLTALGISAWLYGKLSGPGASAARKLTGLGLALLIAVLTAVMVLPGGNAAAGEVRTAAADETGYSSWIEFSPDTVQAAVGGEHPVFIAFSAKWCMTCRTNERAVIFTDEVQQFFSDTGAVLIHGDFTNRNPEINEWLLSFGRAGVPFYSWYPAGETEAVLLPEIITKQMITDLSVVDR